MRGFPQKGNRIRWTNIPKRCKDDGDEFGTFEYRNGEYLYCRMDGTNSIMELYRNEIEIIT